MAKYTDADHLLALLTISEDVVDRFGLGELEDPVAAAQARVGSEPLAEDVVRVLELVRSGGRQSGAELAATVRWAATLAAKLLGRAAA